MKFPCFGCDAPEDGNCACHTQLETPKPLVVDGVEFPGPKKNPTVQALMKDRRTNVSSGEDARTEYYYMEIA